MGASYLHLFFCHCDFCSGYPWNQTSLRQICGRKYRPFLHLHHFLLWDPVLHSGHIIHVSQDWRELHRQSLFLWTKPREGGERGGANKDTYVQQHTSKDRTMLAVNHCTGQQVSNYKNANKAQTFGQATLLHPFTFKRQGSGLRVQGGSMFTWLYN